MEMKLAPLSLAAALATSVLPQPGGPYSSTPVGADRPSAVKRSGCLMGSVTEKVNSSLTCAAGKACQEWGWAGAQRYTFTPLHGVC